MQISPWLLSALSIACLGCSLLSAANIPVANSGQFSAALSSAQPGDTIVVAPGLYSGGHFRAGLTGVTIRGADPQDRPIFRGGSSALQLSDAVDVTLESLIFEHQTGNGLNIDDGGSFETPSTNITLRNLTIRDMDATGNNDGIKLSGVTHFLIDRVEVINWAAGGSAIDPVGSHYGLIQNSLFLHETGANSGIRPKGGSKGITIRANRFELGGGNGSRAIQAGGSTGEDFFRFIDGDSGYEAAEIVAEGNVIVGSHAPFAYVNIDGGLFHHNYAHLPQNWVIRILNENRGNQIVDTQHGQFRDNVIVFDGAMRTAVNVGPETLPETFVFSGNHWFNQAVPNDSTPSLPAQETGGTYGVAPGHVSLEGPIVWSFPWGKWIVNASGEIGEVAAEEFVALKLASPGEGAVFRPLASPAQAEHPLEGEWDFQEVPIDGPLRIDPFSQLVLIEATLCSTCFNPGDYNRDGRVDIADYGAWKADFGRLGPNLSTDGNRDGIVDGADYVIWRNHLSGENAFPEALVPIPAPGGLWGIMWGTSALLVRYYTIH